MDAEGDGEEDGEGGGDVVHDGGGGGGQCFSVAWSTPGSMVCRQRSANSLHATLQDAVPDHCDLSTSVSAPETTHTDTDAGVVPWLHHQSEAVSPSQAQPPPASASRPPIGPLTTSGPASANQAGRDWRLLWQNSVSILQCSQCSLSLSLSLL